MNTCQEFHLVKINKTLFTVPKYSVTIEWE
jgi:hypothetical protein